MLQYKIINKQEVSELERAIAIKQGEQIIEDLLVYTEESIFKINAQPDRQLIQSIHFGFLPVRRVRNHSSWRPRDRGKRRLLLW